jgi:hypothetical protein
MCVGLTIDGEGEKEDNAEDTFPILPVLDPDELEEIFMDIPHALEPDDLIRSSQETHKATADLIRLLNEVRSYMTEPLL